MIVYTSETECLCSSDGDTLDIHPLCKFHDDFGYYELYDEESS